MKCSPIVRDEFFPFMRTEIVNRSALGRFLKDANCLIPNGNLLVRAVNAIEELPLTQGDTKGDLYEYLLSASSPPPASPGSSAPRATSSAPWSKCSIPSPPTAAATPPAAPPASWSASWTTSASKYLQPRTGRGPDSTTAATMTGMPTAKPTIPGDLLEPYREHIQNDMFHGFDFDSTMLRIAAMNMLLHGIESPSIEYQDTLADHLRRALPPACQKPPSMSSWPIPPSRAASTPTAWTPSLSSRRQDQARPSSSSSSSSSACLKKGGRAAVIVPDGVLFGSSSAHSAVRQHARGREPARRRHLPPLRRLQALRRRLHRHPLLHQRRPHRRTSGSTTSQTTASPSTTNARLSRTRMICPISLTQWKARAPKKSSDRTARHFFVPVSEIQGNNYDLSLNRYKETNHVEAVYAQPKVILGKIRELEMSILADINELEGMLK
jgi:type I restriction enzyme M protein